DSSALLLSPAGCWTSASPRPRSTAPDDAKRRIGSDGAQRTSIDGTHSPRHGAQSAANPPRLLSPWCRERQSRGRLWTASPKRHLFPYVRGLWLTLQQIVGWPQLVTGFWRGLP